MKTDFYNVVPCRIDTVSSGIPDVKKNTIQRHMVAYTKRSGSA